MNFEYLPPPGQSNKITYDLPLLQQTTDDVENNLYPFVHLLPDGNLFVFANNRSILLDPRTTKVLREFPVLPGGSRNYPASAISVLLPLDLNRQGRKSRTVSAEVLICGGAPHNAAKLASAKNRVFLPALRSCGRITATKPNPTWRTELMPSPRVMGDVLILPNTDVLILNGARRGTAGWYWGTEPNFQPVLYHPRNRRNNRFRSLTPSTIPRMYHSSSAVLPDTSILVAGSNPIPTYNTTLGPDNPYPTEVRLEKFYPPYFNSSNDPQRPTLISDDSARPSDVKYGQAFSLEFTVTANITAGDVDLKVTMYTPPFTTHAVSMNQRLLVLRMKGWESVGENRYRVTVFAPPTPELAPAGYYMTFVVNRGLPSHAAWIKVHK
ncbi:putative galactose oxidase [Dioscorea sansibarensis]